jgi:hypothetical protein
MKDIGHMNVQREGEGGCEILTISTLKITTIIHYPLSFYRIT